MTRPDEQRHAARGICFWYYNLSTAKAQASRRYRIGNLLEHLTGADAVIAERLPAHVAERLHTLCCVRPQVDAKVARALERLRARGVRLVADFDDLLFAGEVSGLPPFGGNAGQKTRRLSCYSAALDCFDGFTVSTRALLEKLRAAAPLARVSLVPNGLSASWIAQGMALYPTWQPGDPLVIRYFAGSPSHDQDVASITAPLSRFLREHAEARVEVVGPVTLDSSQFPEGRLTFLPAVPYDELPRLLSSSWVSLAPLHASEYGDCKSAIKFLEASAFGCPTLASPNDDLRRHEERGALLLVCRSDGDWYDGLTSLLDPSHRVAMGQAAASYVAAHGMAAESASAWLEAVAAGQGA